MRLHELPDGGKIIFISDITEEVQREEQLRQSQKMEAIGQLSAGLAHDFNNLLMAALGNIEFVEEEAEKPSLKDFAATAKKAILRGAELTNRLLAFSRKQELSPEKTDVGTLVNGLRVLINRTLSENIDIKWDVHKGLWPIVIDRGQLESSLLNLVLNSRDAMLAGGTLSIGCRNESIGDEPQFDIPDFKGGDYIAISVEDTGMGIQKSHLEKIIDPFFTTKKIGEGSGLGLSMVYGFVNQSGGYVDIKSEVGTGTTVTLYLPRCMPDDVLTEIPSNKQDQLPMGHGETILVVEDEIDVREITIQQLKNLGYDVIDGGDGKEVLEKCTEEYCCIEKNIDLVLSDVILSNNVTGIELINIIKICCATDKALLMTGYAENDVINSENGRPYYPVLSKPFTKDELARKISSVLNDEE